MAEHFGAHVGVPTLHWTAGLAVDQSRPGAARPIRIGILLGLAWLKGP
jgi:hypothetical protein